MKSKYFIAAFAGLALAGGLAFVSLSSAQDAGSAPPAADASAASAATKAITIWRDPG